MAAQGVYLGRFYRWEALAVLGACAGARKNGVLGKLASPFLIGHSFQPSMDHDLSATARESTPLCSRTDSFRRILQEAFQDVDTSLEVHFVDGGGELLESGKIIAPPHEPSPCRFSTSSPLACQLVGGASGDSLYWASFSNHSQAKPPST